jgi:iron complex outermembrane receptor protein
MKRFLLSFTAMVLLSHTLLAKYSEFNGKVTDLLSKQPLIAASITIPDLRLSVHTDINGNFSFKNLPDKGNFLVVISYIGYETKTHQLHIQEINNFNAELKPSIIEAREVVVTGSGTSSDNTRNSVSVAVVNKNDLISTGSNNIIDAISTIPGVSQITTGGAISKPVIRGLSYNRVTTLNDGVKQEGQQWGDEHGIEIDQYRADRIEVLRGPASLLYGSDALGGVINILSPFPVSEGKMRGEILSNYATNNGLTSSSAMLEGNTKGIVYNGRFSYKNANSFSNPTQGYVPNTAFNETNFSGLLGVNKKWGFVHLNYSNFLSNIGLPEVELNNNNEFLDEDGDLISKEDAKSRTLVLPYQEINHQKVALNSNILIGNGQLKSVLAYQNNVRKEFEETTEEPGLFFDLNTYSYDFKYFLAVKNGWESIVGLSGMIQNSKNKGDEFLVPDYNSTDFGSFIYFRKNWITSTLNFGGRFDTRKIEGEELIEDNDIRFSSFSNNFSNLSGALGFTHELNNHWSLKANAGSAFRAPNIAELASNGVHEGAFRYEIGNNNLKPEKSFQLDGSISYHTDYIGLSLGAYLNYINDYIYYRQLNNEETTIDTDIFPVYRYVQADASLNGVEADLTLHPVKWFHFENTFSYTLAKNRETNNPLPFIPAANLRNQIRFEPEIKGVSNSFISFELDNNFKQNRIDEFETKTNSYTLFNASLGTSFNLGKMENIQLFVKANNLFDKEYVNHLSRLKPVGIYNMGRNIGFGFYLPLNFN